MENESASAEEYKGDSSQEINSKDQFVFPQKHTDTESKLIRNDDVDVFDYEGRGVYDDEDDQPEPTAIPERKRIKDSKKLGKRRNSEKFIDFEQDLYEDQDDERKKEDIEEAKDKVGPLPGGKKRMKTKNFVSNISK